MTTTLPRPPKTDRACRDWAAQAEGSGTGAIGLAVEHVVPEHLLDGGEIVYFAIKPSAWYVLLTSLRWIVVAVVIALIASGDFISENDRWYGYRIAVIVAGARIGWAMLDWASRLYVLTNRRIMRIRGMFNAELFECPLARIQNTHLRLSVPERITRTGTLTFQTAAGGGTASWRVVARPLEVYERVRDAIIRAQNRGNHDL